VESVEEDNPEDPDDAEDEEELLLTLFGLGVTLGEEGEPIAKTGLPGATRCRRFFPVGGSGGATELGVCGIEVCEDFVGVSSSCGGMKASSAS